jgi:hypothetical protein
LWKLVIAFCAYFCAKGRRKFLVLSAPTTIPWRSFLGKVAIVDRKNLDPIFNVQLENLKITYGYIWISCIIICLYYSRIPALCANERDAEIGCGDKPAAQQQNNIRR